MAFTPAAELTADQIVDAIAVALREDEDELEAEDEEWYAANDYDEDADAEDVADLNNLTGAQMAAALGLPVTAWQPAKLNPAAEETVRRAQRQFEEYVAARWEAYAAGQIGFDQLMADIKASYRQHAHNAYLAGRMSVGDLDEPDEDAEDDFEDEIEDDLDRLDGMANQAQTMPGWLNLLFLGLAAWDVHDITKLTRHLMNRTKMYSSRMRGLSQFGQQQALVDAGPGVSERTLAWWNLGGKDHCEDCIRLSDGSPYVLNAIYGEHIFPGSGHTRCGANCRCSFAYDVPSEVCGDGLGGSELPSRLFGSLREADADSGRVYVHFMEAQACKLPIPISSFNSEITDEPIKLVDPFEWDSDVFSQMVFNNPVSFNAMLGSPLYKTALGWYTRKLPAKKNLIPKVKAGKDLEFVDSGSVAALKTRTVKLGETQYAYVFHDSAKWNGTFFDVGTVLKGTDAFDVQFTLGAFNDLAIHALNAGTDLYVNSQTASAGMRQWLGTIGATMVTVSNRPWWKIPNESLDEFLSKTLVAKKKAVTPPTPPPSVIVHNSTHFEPNPTPIAGALDPPDVPTGISVEDFFDTYALDKGFGATGAAGASTIPWEKLGTPDVYEIAFPGLDQPFKQNVAWGYDKLTLGAIKPLNPGLSAPLNEQSLMMGSAFHAAYMLEQKNFGLDLYISYAAMLDTPGLRNMLDDLPIGSFDSMDNYVVTADQMADFIKLANTATPTTSAPGASLLTGTGIESSQVAKYLDEWTGFSETASDVVLTGPGANLGAFLRKNEANQELIMDVLTPSLATHALVERDAALLTMLAKVGELEKAAQLPDWATHIAIPYMDLSAEMRAFLIKNVGAFEDEFAKRLRLFIPDLQGLSTDLHTAGLVAKVAPGPGAAVAPATGGQVFLYDDVLAVMNDWNAGNLTLQQANDAIAKIDPYHALIPAGSIPTGSAAAPKTAAELISDFGTANGISFEAMQSMQDMIPKTPYLKQSASSRTQSFYMGGSYSSRWTHSHGNKRLTWQEVKNPSAWMAQADSVAVRMAQLTHLADQIPKLVGVQEILIKPSIWLNDFKIQEILTKHGAFAKGENLLIDVNKFMALADSIRPPKTTFVPSAPTKPGASIAAKVAAGPKAVSPVGKAVLPKDGALGPTFSDLIGSGFGPEDLRHAMDGTLVRGSIPTDGTTDTLTWMLQVENMAPQEVIVTVNAGAGQGIVKIRDVPGIADDRVVTAAILRTLKYIDDEVTAGRLFDPFSGITIGKDVVDRMGGFSNVLSKLGAESMPSAWRVRRPQLGTLTKSFNDQPVPWLTPNFAPPPPLAHLAPSMFQIGDVTPLPSVQWPDVAALQLKPGDAKAELGGWTRKALFFDATGDLFMFKPGASGRAAETAMIADQLAQQLGLPVPPILKTKMPMPTSTGKTQNTQGQLQKMIPGASGISSPSVLTPSQTEDLWRHSVLDYFMMNDDAHIENFIIDGSGALWGIDKDRAFLGLKTSRDTLSPDHDGWGLVPLKNLWWRDVRKNPKLLENLSPAAMSETFARLEGMSDDMLRQIMEPLRSHVPGKDFSHLGSFDYMLAEMISRKNRVRGDFEDLFAREIRALRTSRPDAVPKMWTDWLDSGGRFTASGVDARAEVLAIKEALDNEFGTYSPTNFKSLWNDYEFREARSLIDQYYSSGVYGKTTGYGAELIRQKTGQAVFEKFMRMSQWALVNVLEGKSAPRTSGYLTKLRDLYDPATGRLRLWRGTSASKYGGLKELLEHYEAGGIREMFGMTANFDTANNFGDANLYIEVHISQVYANFATQKMYSNDEAELLVYNVRPEQIFAVSSKRWSYRGAAVPSTPDEMWNYTGPRIIENP